MFERYINSKIIVGAVSAALVVAFFVSISAAASEKKLTKRELKDLIAHAETKAQHQQIANYFDDEANRFAAEAQEHSELAEFYEKHSAPQPTKFPGTHQTSSHCSAVSKSLSQAADNARAIAAEHRKMADEAKK